MDAEPFVPFNGTEAAWEDAYARALTAMQPAVAADAAVAAAATARAAYGIEVQPATQRTSTSS